MTSKRGEEADLSFLKDKVGKRDPVADWALRNTRKHQESTVFTGRTQSDTCPCYLGQADQTNLLDFEIALLLDSQMFLQLGKYESILK